MSRVEREITAPVDLCDAAGRLHRAAVGFSRRPLHRCNVSGHAGRKKRWDYWCVTTDSHLLALTVADLDYLGLVNAYFLDYATGRAVDATVPLPFGLGLRLPETVAGADIRFEGLGLRVAMLEETAGTCLLAEVGWPHADRLAADIFVELPAGHETLGVVVPWSDERFQYTSKHNTRPARGRVIANGKTYAFGPRNGAFGCLDFGRGVWPYRCAWNWASASGVQSGVTLGLQFGGLWTDGTGMTENALCVDGRLHKIHEDVIFEYDRSSFTAPWRVRTPLSGRVNLRLTPFFERTNKVHLGIARSEVHQMFGRFDGTVETAEGKRIEVADMVGWAEEHRALW
jgi:hypothetical protein